MMKLFKRKTKNETKQRVIPNVSNIPISLEPPKGWYVQQAFQNPMFMLWDVVLVSFDDVCNNIEKPRHYVATEKDTYKEALQECIDNCC